MTPAPDDALARALASGDVDRIDDAVDDVERDNLTVGKNMLRAYRLGQQAAAPGVPREPTAAMVKAGASVLYHHGDGPMPVPEIMRRVWRNMLNAHDAALRSNDRRQAARAGGEEGT